MIGVFNALSWAIVMCCIRETPFERSKSFMLTPSTSLSPLPSSPNKDKEPLLESTTSPPITSNTQDTTITIDGNNSSSTPITTRVTSISSGSSWSRKADDDPYSDISDALRHDFIVSFIHGTRKHYKAIEKHRADKKMPGHGPWCGHSTDLKEDEKCQHLHEMEQRHQQKMEKIEQQQQQQQQQAHFTPQKRKNSFSLTNFALVKDPSVNTMLERTLLTRIPTDYYELSPEDFQPMNHPHLYVPKFSNSSLTSSSSSISSSASESSSSSATSTSLSSTSAITSSPSESISPEKDEKNDNTIKKSNSNTKNTISGGTRTRFESPGNSISSTNSTDGLDYEAIYEERLRRPRVIKKITNILDHATELEYEFTACAATLFQKIRLFRNITDRDFVRSLSGDFSKEIDEKHVQNLLGTFTEAGSGSFFWSSYDGRYRIKTLEEEEYNLLHEKFLSDYYDYIIAYPETLLPKFYALYQIKMYGHTQYLIVMNNVFWDDRIEEEVFPVRKYDLKGSAIDRYVEAEDFGPKKKK